MIRVPLVSMENRIRFPTNAFYEFLEVLTDERLAPQKTNFHHRAITQFFENFSHSARG